LFTDGMLQSLILDLDEAGFKDWDVAIYVGLGLEVEFAGIRLRTQKRKCDDPDGILRINGEKMRVASRGSERLGLSNNEISRAHAEFERYQDALEQSERRSNNISDSFYRQFRPRPLLMIHLVEPYLEDSRSDGKKVIPSLPQFVVAIGLSIPACELLNNRSSKYAINLVEQRQAERKILGENNEDEDDV
jgi:hypothetical protein